jgi:hypothetical protein
LSANSRAPSHCGCADSLPAPAPKAHWPLITTHSTSPFPQTALAVMAQHVEELAEVLVRQGISSKLGRSGQRQGQQLAEEGSPQPCEPLLRAPSSQVLQEWASRRTAAARESLARRKSDHAIGPGQTGWARSGAPAHSPTARRGPAASRENRTRLTECCLISRTQIACGVRRQSPDGQTGVMKADI